MSLPLLYKDDTLVAVNKPSGLLVHRSNLDRQAQQFALQMVRDQLGRHVFPVHRLDRGASGVLVFARSPEIAQGMGALFEQHQVQKHYLAVVRGHTAAEGEIDHPLTRRYDDFEFRPKSLGLDPLPARTRYRCLATVELPHAVDRYQTSRYALLQLQPLTGRKHQIRRHLKHIAHPIIGDATYGKGAHNRLFLRLFESRRLLLACVELRFSHPATGEAISIRAPLTRDFVSVMQLLHWGSLVGWTPVDLYSGTSASTL